MKILPIFKVRLWRCNLVDDRALILRPGSGIYLQRLLLAVTMVGVTAILQTQYSNAVEFLNEPVASGFSDPELQRLEAEMMATARDALPEDQYKEMVVNIEKKRRERARVREVSRYRKHMVFYWGRNILAVGFLMLGGLPLLSTLWNRVLVERDVRGNVIVRSRYWWPRTASWPIEKFDRIVVGARERVGHDEHRRVVRHGWIWTVQLGMKGQAAIPMAMSLAFGDMEMGPQFVVGRVGKRPLTGESLPGPVKELAEALSDITGLPMMEPVIIEGKVRDIGNGALSSTFSVMGEPELLSQQSYGSLDEMPPEVRKRAEAMIEEGRVNEIVKKESYIIRDDSGIKRTYKSWDDLPQEWKNRIKRHK